MSDHINSPTKTGNAMSGDSPDALANQPEVVVIPRAANFSMSEAQNQAEFPPLPGSDKIKTEFANQQRDTSSKSKHSGNGLVEAIELNQQHSAEVSSVAASVNSDKTAVQHVLETCGTDSDACSGSLDTLPTKIEEDKSNDAKADPPTHKTAETSVMSGKPVNGNSSKKGKEPELSTRITGIALPKAQTKDIHGGLAPHDQRGFKGLQHLRKTFDAYNFYLQGIDPGELGIDFDTHEKISTQVYSLFDTNPPQQPKVNIALPESYRINNIQDLRTVVPRFRVSVLMYIFYAFPNDKKQILAGFELYKRQWRWHITKQLWLIASPEFPMAQQLNNTQERGWYMFWNTKTWTAEKIFMTVDYTELELNPPQI